MEHRDELPVNVSELLILSWNFIKLQPQRREKRL